MKHRTKFNQEHEQTGALHSHGQTARQFANSDELLRFDAAETTVPPEIAERLAKSTAIDRPAQSRPWWKQLFRR